MSVKPNKSYFFVKKQNKKKQKKRTRLPTKRPTPFKQPSGEGGSFVLNL